METNTHGTPCWFELGASDLNGASTFYTAVLGWEISKSAMEGLDYRFATSGKDMVAGMMLNPNKNVPPSWLIYLAVDNCDQAIQAISTAGGRTHKDAEDIPGTGRYAVVSDPQGAVFGIIQLESMQKGEDGCGPAFQQDKAGHGNWIELMSSDPDAAFQFYAQLFGWEKGESLDMGEIGEYQLFRHAGAEIGGMMGLADAPFPVWLPYFGVNDVRTAMAAIKAAGGEVQQGPFEVPGPAYIVVATDPQGAYFAVVAPK
ncbi:MAG: VOC family protein [Desulfobulbaceae bacterium]|nr:VOC family protein [Desulfobulbaceae bacterium]